MKFSSSMLILLFNNSGPVARPYNNWLYRSGLDPLSATNLCYDIFYNICLLTNGINLKIHVANKEPIIVITDTITKEIING